MSQRLIAALRTLQCGRDQVIAECALPAMLAGRVPDASMWPRSGDRGMSVNVKGLLPARKLQCGRDQVIAEWGLTGIFLDPPYSFNVAAIR